MRATAVLALLGAAVALSTPPAFSQAPALPLPTPAEVADYLAFTGPDEVAPYLGRVAGAAEGVRVGTLPGAESIPVLRIDPVAAPATQPEGAGAGAGGGSGAVVRVLIVGAQHGDERAGLETSLRLARDLAAGSLAALRGRLDVHIVPMANPGGVRAGDRFTPDGIDMNRDHVRLAAPETRALWREFTAWRPHLVLDLHEIGPSEYSLQIGVPTHPNVDPDLAAFGRFFMLPHAAKALSRADVRYHEYVAPWQSGSTAEIAAAPTDTAGAETSASWYTPPPTDPMSARNAFALAGSLAFLVETASSRDVLGLEERTDRMYVAAAALLEVASELAADLVTAAERAAAGPDGPLALRSRYVGRAPGARLPWVFINDRGQQEQGYLQPWRSELQVDAERPRPVGWWIVGEPPGLFEALAGHGYDIGAESAWSGAGLPASAERLAYPRCGDVTAGWPPPPRPLEDARRVPPGRWLPADQRGARLLFTMIEPGSEGGWFDASSADCAGPAVPPADSLFPVLRIER